MPTLDVTDCDANDAKGCAAGLVCGKDNCEMFHPNLAAAGMSGSSDCCEEDSSTTDGRYGRNINHAQSEIVILRILIKLNALIGKSFLVAAFVVSCVYMRRILRHGA